MEEETKVSMYINQGCLVVPIQADLYTESVLQIQKDILKAVYDKRIKGVIIDVSAVAIIDSIIAQKIFDSAKMTSLLGAKTIITGLQPGVVASLIDLDFEPGDVPTAINLEEGFRILEPILKAKEKIQEADEPAVEIDQNENATAEGADTT
jgi:rsbT antagonist protein RsbS